jgi:chromosomal replication initiator protein
MTTHGTSSSDSGPPGLANAMVVWQSALGRLSSKVSPQNFDMWLRPIECVGQEGTVLHLRAPNSYVRLWFESNYLETVLDDLRATTGVPYRVELSVELGNARRTEPA